VKVGDLVKVNIPESLAGEHAGKIGILVHYFDEKTAPGDWNPKKAICMVLLAGKMGYFYADELENLSKKD